MIRIKSVENKFALVIILILLIFIIGFIDYRTDSNISFSFFYLIPISFAALHNKSNKTIIMIIVLASSIAWLIADIKFNKYTSSGLPIWNGFVRFFIFSMIGLLLFNIKRKE